MAALIDDFIMTDFEKEEKKLWKLGEFCKLQVFNLSLEKLGTYIRSNMLLFIKFALEYA